MNALPSLLTGQLDIWTSAETEKKSGRGRSSGNGTSVYGIKKLRELILELAVRGKLVPQDPNDEPAGELLKRIQVEKARLMAEGKIKKDKPLPPISDEEKPFELPRGWQWVRLGDISSAVQYGYTDSANHQSKDVLLLRITDIQDDAVNWTTVPGCNISLSDYESYELKNDDLVIARTGGTIGKSYLVTGLDQKAIFASYLIRIGNLASTSSEYKKVFLGSVLYWKQLIANSMGTGQPNVNGTALKTLIFPLPPLREQHRIVAKVDELMALCDQLETLHNNAAEAHEKLVNHLLGTLTQSQSTEDFSTNWQRIAAHFGTLFTTEISIDALKQTLLQLAVMGKLVPQDPDDEPASELLKRIQAEKAKLVAEGKIKKDKPLPPISEEEKPFELPRGWEWVRLCEITSKITDGDHKTPPRILDGFRLLSAKNVRDGHLDLDNCDFISKQDYLKSRERCCPDTGDLLIVSVGGTIGRTSLVPDYSDFALVRSVALIKPLLLNSYYLKQAMDSNLLQESIHARKRGGAQPCLYLSEIEQFVFSLPPLAEQHRIVTKVDELIALCDQLKSRITQASQLQKKLSDGVVEQAIAS